MTESIWPNQYEQKIVNMTEVMTTTNIKLYNRKLINYYVNELIAL